MEVRRYAPLALGVVIALTLVACSSSGSGGSSAEPIEPSPITSPPASEAPTDTEAGALIVTAPVNAIQLGFEPTILDVPADEGFTITFNNDDPGIPHNIQVFEGAEASGKPIWAPKDNAVINGGESSEYDIPALAAGSYAFNCYVHPTMVGTLTVA
ncbi:MAG: cupredoxin domain-containing protein [Actinomycetota bacterium]